MDVVDTGGMYQEKEDFFSASVMEQAHLAAEEAHLVLMVVDGRRPVQDADRRIARTLHKTLSSKPVLLAVNKLDSEPMRDEAARQPFRNLGLGEPFFVSALHAHGTDELAQAAVRLLFPEDAPMDRRAERRRQIELAKQRSIARKDDAIVDEMDERWPEDDTRPLRLACVGVPNAGKSSLVNRILGPGELRSMTSPIPGTTHDTVDTPVRWRGERDLILLDTAGIDRRAKAARASLERSAVLFAIKTIQSADVNLLVIDAARGVTGQEKRIAGHILESKSSVVVVVNKCDLLVDQKRTTYKGEWKTCFSYSYVFLFFVVCN